MRGSQVILRDRHDTSALSASRRQPRACVEPSKRPDGTRSAPSHTWSRCRTRCWGRFPDCRPHNECSRHSPSSPDHPGGLTLQTGVTPQTADRMFPSGLSGHPVLTRPDTAIAVVSWLPVCRSQSRALPGVAIGRNTAWRVARHTNPARDGGASRCPRTSRASARQSRRRRPQACGDLP